MAIRKSVPVKTAQKSAAKKSAARENVAAKSTAKTAAKKMASKRPAAKKTAGKKTAAGTSGRSSTGNYTNPDLREKIKQRVIAGDKGGRPGQWSARKAQLLAHEYEAEGGGYKHERDAAQQSLKNWGDEHWHTEDGKEAVEEDVTHRYLPDAAWKELSPEQRKATDRKKIEGSKGGEQFVPNTAAASKARKHATRKH